MPSLPPASPAQVTLSDVSGRTCQFSLLGPQAAPLLEGLGVDTEALGARGHGAHALMGLNGAPVMVALGGGLVPGQGYTLVADEACAGELWTALAGKVGGRGGGGAADLLAWRGKAEQGGGGRPRRGAILAAAQACAARPLPACVAGGWLSPPPNPWCQVLAPLC